MTKGDREALVSRLTTQLGGAIPTCSLSELLFEALERAGWERPSARSQRIQVKGGRGRGRQQNQNMAIRRVFVGYFFKRLSKSLRAKPQSAGTAQAIIGRLDDLQLGLPPVTERTVQADIRAMQMNGNHGF